MTFDRLLVSSDHRPESDRAATVAAQIATAAGLPVELLPACDGASALVQALHDRPAALPVIGTAAPGSPAEALGASAWESALRATDRPALLVGPRVRDEPLPLERLDVALPSEVDQDHLLTVLEDWSATFGATVSLIELVDEVGGAAELASRRSLYAAARSVRHRGLPIATRIVPSRHPAQALLAITVEAPAILAVPATWGDEAPPRLPGLATEILRSATRPVLLFPAHPSVHHKDSPIIREAS